MYDSKKLQALAGELATLSEYVASLENQLRQAKRTIARLEADTRTPVSWRGDYDMATRAIRHGKLTPLAWFNDVRQPYDKRAVALSLANEIVDNDLLLIEPSKTCRNMLTCSVWVGAVERQ